MDRAARKTALRARILAECRDHPPTPVEAEAAARLLVQTGEFRAAAGIGLYAALSDELSTEPLERAARQAGKRVALPRILPGRRLEFVWNRSFEELRPGRYGVPEAPAGGELASLGDLDVLVVPGVAFDRAGGRLGRGAGYYDRALAARVGRVPYLFGFIQRSRIVEEVPMEEFDQRVDAVVTGREIIRRERPE